MNLKCIVIDDEFLARQYLTEYIKKIPFLEFMGDFNSPLKAIDLIKSGEIDLVFVDIQMPEITGIEFLRTLDKLPYVIITTAYKEYAVEGFELNVSDYLLKPFSFERFLTAVNKVEKLKENEDSPKEIHPDQGNSEATLHDQFLVIRADRKHYKINYDDLIFIEGQKAYVSFQTKNKRITALASLRELEEKLPNNQFIRIHKSYIASIKHIESIEGNMIDILDHQLPIGKSYRSDVLKLFGIED